MLDRAAKAIEHESWLANLNVAIEKEDNAGIEIDEHTQHDDEGDGLGNEHLEENGQSEELKDQDEEPGLNQKEGTRANKF
jgi:hypothetical protein